MFLARANKADLERKGTRVNIVPIQLLNPGEKLSEKLNESKDQSEMLWIELTWYNTWLDWIGLNGRDWIQLDDFWVYLTSKLNDNDRWVLLVLLIAFGLSAGFKRENVFVGLSWMPFGWVSDWILKLLIMYDRSKY